MTTASGDPSTDLQAAFSALFEGTQHRVYALALSLCRNRHEAEEIAQEAFLRAYRALRSYSPERRRSLQRHAWMAKIALNVWRNRVRGKKHLDVPLDERWPDASAGPADRAVRDDEARRVRALVADLPDRYRLPLLLRFAYDLPYEGIAKTLGVPVGTAKANVHRATRLLRAAHDAMPRKDR